MATYIVGDVHGCFDQLKQLTEQVNFDPKRDELWLTGDLISRGPESLKVLRYVKNLGKSATIILGNHELHLFTTYLGHFKANKKDRTQQILDAIDCDELIDWLRHQPLLASHPQHDFVMCHAGIYPKWTLDQAQKYATEVEDILQSDRLSWLVKNMYGNETTYWDTSLQGIDRYKFIINAFTRMRFCTPDLGLDMKNKTPIDEVDPNKLAPWFSYIETDQYNKQIIFGHWGALMGHKDKHVIGLDTGCFWGHHLTMLRWEDQKEFTIKGTV